jgi:hypothetical protein
VQLVLDTSLLGEGRAGEIHQMCVVSEEKDLGMLGELGEDPERRSGSGVVEVNQNIV